MSRDLLGVQTLRTGRNSTFRMSEYPFDVNRCFIRKPFTWSSEAVYPIRDTSITCVIIDWRHHGNVLEIHGIDMSCITIIFQYYRPCELQGGCSTLYPWLSKGSVILISMCTIKEYDSKHDIITVTRSDHTVVTSVHNPTTCVDALRTTLATSFETFIDGEICRYAALRNGKMIYGNLESCNLGNLESCMRKRMHHAELHSQDVDDPQKRFQVNGELFAQLPPGSLLQTFFNSEASGADRSITLQWDLLLKPKVYSEMENASKTTYDIVWAKLGV